MKVKELIEELKKHDPEHRVVISGYEGGYEDVHSANPMLIELDVNSEEWYYGSHEETYSKNKKAVPAVYIG